MAEETEQNTIVEFPGVDSSSGERDTESTDDASVPARDGENGDSSPEDLEGVDEFDELTEGELVERFAGYVYSIVDKIWTSRRCEGLSREDLHSYAFSGLIEAFRNYDSDRAAEFSSFAYLRIRGAVIDALRRVQRAPRGVEERRRDDVGSTRANATSRQFREAAEHGPFDLSASNLPADEPMFTFLMAPAEMQRLEFGRSNAQEQRVELDQKLDLLREAMDELSEFERTIVRLYDLEGRSMPEIADEMGCSKSWVTRVRDRALDELREHMEAATESGRELGRQRRDAA